MCSKSEIIKHCSNWYQSLTGQTSLDSVELYFEKILSEIFGYYAIQIGALSGECDLLHHSRIAASFSLASPNYSLALNNALATRLDNTGSRRSGDSQSSVENCALIANNQQLPISTDNVDLVVASHILESSQNPHQVLREIDRVLVPEGHCILIGFNPYSPSNVKSNLLRSLKSADQENYKMRSVSRVRDWFSLLGFEVLDVNYLGFRPTLKNKKIFDALSWLDSWGEYAGPLMGSMYIVHAKKQVAAIRPDKKVWRAPALLKGGKVALNRTAQKVRRDNFSKL